MGNSYLRMLRKTATRPRRREPYSAYILRCADGTLYTGIAKDVAARLARHNTGRGAAYTRTRRPVALLYQEACRDRGAALVREYEIKRMPKQKKERLASAALRPLPRGEGKPGPAPGGRGGKRGPVSRTRAGAAALCLLWFAGGLGAAEPGTTVLATVPEGWELDRVEESGQATLPRVAWSLNLDTVLFVARSGDRRQVAVNAELRDADEVGTLGFTPDGLRPAFSYRTGAGETLVVGARRFGPFEAVGRPALSPDGARAAFRARAGAEPVLIADGRELARGPGLSEPVLDPLGRVAFWARDGERWVLWWDGRAAPGTPFTAHGGRGAAETGDPVFSPDGRHLAFWRRRADGRLEVLWDGRAGEPWLAVGEPVFSPDGGRLAYGAAAGPDFELNTMVCDGRRIQTLEVPSGATATARVPRSIRSLWGTRFLRDGRLAWFAALAGGRACFVLGDEASAEFDSVGQPAYDALSRRAAFVGVAGGKSRVVLDGRPGPAYDAVTFLQFDPEGRRFAYTARRGAAAVVVLDGREGEAFDEVGWVRFPPGGGIAYWGRRGAQWHAVVDGAQTAVAVGADLVGNLILAGAAGRTPVYSVRQGRDWFLVAGAARHGPFDEIGAFRYDPGRGGVVCGVRRGREFQRRVLPLLEPK